MPIVLHAESLTVGPGGQTIRLVQEARRLNSLPGWMCWVAGRDGGPLEHLRGEPWYVPFHFPKFRYHPVAIYRAARLIRRTGAEVVHTHSSADSWVFGIAARLVGIPIVRGRHVSRPLRAKRIRNFVYEYLADAFTVSGRTVGRILRDGGVAREEQIFETGGGFEPARFNPDVRDPEYLRSELGLPSNATILGAACTLRSTKGVDILVDALVRLRESRPELEVHVVVAGAIYDEEEAPELAARAPGFVHFLGFREDIEKVMGGMDLLVAPSRFADGIPQVIPQAMAMKVPVIGTRAGGIPDAILDGETGFLVEPENPDALARKISDVLDMDAVALTPILERARERALGHFTFDRIVDTYQRAYRWVLGHPDLASPV